MNESLITYLNDHLAGSQFAVSLLADLSTQTNNQGLALFSGKLLREVEEDQAALADCLSAVGGEADLWKKASAWIVQKAGKAKLAIGEPLGQFEAVEMLMLGVTGKLALWDALKVTACPELPLTTDQLCSLAQRATDQKDRLETLRIQLSTAALRPA